MNVRNFGSFNIDLDMITDLAETHNYWAGVQKFLGDIEGKELHELSGKQVNWLDRVAGEYESKHEKFCNK